MAFELAGLYSKSMDNDKIHKWYKHLILKYSAHMSRSRWREYYFYNSKGRLSSFLAEYMQSSILIYLKQIKTKKVLKHPWTSSYIEIFKDEKDQNSLINNYWCFTLSCWRLQNNSILLDISLLLRRSKCSSERRSIQS